MLTRCPAQDLLIAGPKYVKAVNLMRHSDSSEPASPAKREPEPEPVMAATEPRELQY